MRGKVITITLNPAVDRLVRLEKFSAGTEHRAGAGLVSAGGKGINAARALRALAVPVMAGGMCGGAAGDLLTALLQKENLPHSFSRIKGETRTNTTMVDRAGAVTRVIESGPLVTVKEQRAFAALLPEYIKDGAGILFCGSLPPGISAAAFARILAAVKGKVPFIGVDTSGDGLKAAIKAKVDMIKPNRAEAEEVLGRRMGSAAAVEKALAVFLGYGVRQVLISLGKDGLAASDGHDAVWVRVPPVKGGHAVGCGDAALAGFVAGRLAGKSFAECADLAAGCGTANMFAAVPGGISRNIVRKLGL
ncbi:MAG: 1-phosphofructokinase family hexose kinase [Candidatus Omnitrophota bacterium]